MSATTPDEHTKATQGQASTLPEQIHSAPTDWDARTAEILEALKALDKKIDDGSTEAKQRARRDTVGNAYRITVAVVGGAMLAATTCLLSFSKLDPSQLFVTGLLAVMGAVLVFTSAFACRNRMGF